MKINLKILGSDQQLCRGQKGGIEHVIHSLRAFKNTDSEAIFAKNASNSLNRDLALRKTQKLCPSLDHSICNAYREPSNLFIYKQTIFSQEGTSQGDPLAISLNGIAIIPLIKIFDSCFTIQKWYADDGNAAGSLDNF